MLVALGQRTKVSGFPMYVLGGIRKGKTKGTLVHGPRTRLEDAKSIHGVV